MMQVRLSKIMSERGICSRREADGFIERGLVLVNGTPAVLGQKIDPEAVIELLPEAKKAQKAKVTLILHKPIGYVSTQPEKGYKAAIELIRSENQVGKGPRFSKAFLKGLSTAGRLDIDSKGLLLFSQDGTVVKSIIGPDSSTEKEYLVRVEGEVTGGILNKLRFGLKLDGEALKRARVEEIHKGLLKMVLTQGKKRQIRRMCEKVGLKVVSLKRVRIGSITLSHLPEGKWSLLT